MGVTWSKNVPEAPQVKYRTLSKDQVWSEWQGSDPEKGAGEKTVSVTEPIVVTEVSQVQVKTTLSDGSTPEGLKVTVINPGVGTGDSQGGSRRGSAQLRSVEEARGVAIHSRSDWGADER